MALFPQPLEYAEIGKVGRVQGMDGAMRILLHYTGVKEVPSVVFLDHCATYLPFHVNAWPVEGGRSLFRLQGVESRSEASRFGGSRIFIDAATLSAYLKGTIYALVGYGVEDVQQGFLGTILSVEGRMLQPLLCLSEDGGKKRLLPFDASFVKAIDEEKKRVVMSLPEALLV